MSEPTEDELQEVADAMTDKGDMYGVVTKDDVRKGYPIVERHIRERMITEAAKIGTCPTCGYP